MATSRSGRGVSGVVLAISADALQPDEPGDMPSPVRTYVEVWTEYGELRIPTDVLPGRGIGDDVQLTIHGAEPE